MISYDSITSWSDGSIVSLFFVTGVYLVVNIFKMFSNEYYYGFMNYFSFIPYLFLISLILGLSFKMFFDSFEIYQKILWGLFAVVILTMISAFYYFFSFYNHIIKYLIIVPFIIIFIFFEFIDFRYFRK
jgi:hypothetical protein